MKAKLTIFLFLLAIKSTLAQTTIFSENMGTPSSTTAISSNTFQNGSTLTYSNGTQTNSADVRSTSVSSSYSGASGGGNVYFTSTSGTYGFAIENINASQYTSIYLQFGYKKESASAHAIFSVDYWNGSSWITLANTSSTLFNESSSASAVWYLSKGLALPTDAQINGLKIRFVKTGTVAIRIDDVKLTGIETLPTVSNTLVSNITNNSATFAGNVTATGGANITATGTVFSPTSTNANPTLGGSGTTTISTPSPNSGTGIFSNGSGTVFSPNIQYSYNAYATKSTGSTGYGTVGTFYTLAVTPSSPTVNSPSASSLHVTIGTDTNSSITTYAINETTSGNYVQANGSLGSTPVYQTISAWGTKTVTGLAATTTYTFSIIAKNGDGVLTAAGSSVSGTTLTTSSINTSGTLSAVSTTYGTASSSVNFSVSGSNLTDDIVISAPTGYEISKTAGGATGYASTQTLNPISGTVNPTAIYVRLAATTPFGSYSGNVNLVSTNDGLNVNVATVSSSVSKLGLNITGISILDKVYDGNTNAAISGTPTLNGILTNDINNVGLVNGSGSASFANASIGDGKPVTVIGYTLNGSAAGNYELTQPSGFTAKITANKSSDIVLNTSSSTNSNTNIDYSQYQGTTLTNTSTGVNGSTGVLGFYLRDGGAGMNDADDLPTELTGLTVNLINSSNIRSMRLFVGNSPRGNAIAVNGASVITFTGLSNIVAADNDQLAISLRVTFNSTVIDNQQVGFIITGVTEKETGSRFAAYNGGGVNSLTTGDINRIEVTADRLAFIQQPTPNILTGAIMEPSPTVEAKDANGNRDIDFSGNVSITSSGTLSSSPQNAVALQGLATFSNINHTAVGYGLVLTAAYSGLTSAVSNTFTVKIDPLFTQVPPICFGSELAPLPTISNNGITGTWSPNINNLETTSYTFTPNGMQGANSVSMTIVVNSDLLPTFDEIEPICPGSTLNTLPSTSTNGIVGTWEPAVLDNTATTNYTFTPQSGQCATSAILTVTVNQLSMPTFEEVVPQCTENSINALPTTSLEGITGTWSPALNNTATTTYTFTPNPGQCADTTELTIEIIPTTIPTFETIEPICSGTTATVLLETSLEGITGIWTPAFDNTTTKTYTFDPGTTQCAVKTSLQVVVNPSILPTFDSVDPICSGDTLNELPTTSTNGITGSWSPDIDNTVTTTYTFTPDLGQECASPATLTIIVNPNIPTFNAVAPICAGATLNALPITSTNGYNGTWFPELDNTNTTTYTFIPTEGQCASNISLTIEVNQLTPEFSNLTLCTDTLIENLPSTSTNGINGTWSVSTNDQVTIYTFTPGSGQCATGNILSLPASPNLVPTFSPVDPVVEGAEMTALPTTSLNGIDGSWSPELNNTETTTYTFTPNYGQCATTTTLTIEILSARTSTPPLSEYGVQSTGSSSEVGVTPGTLSVSGSGAANYSVAIQVPPGINGVVPQVGLVYNSQGGFGVAGYGWYLTGLSTITRAACTIAQDGFIDPVDFDSNDRFSLDGQRLMLKSGTYGAANSVYETENFSNTKITFLGTHFKVEYPNGAVALYGSTTDSKVGTLTYALKQWSNPQGVSMLYYYTPTNNTLYINSIKYGGPSATAPQLNEIQFIYNNRNRSDQYYIGGINIKNEKVLSQIRVKANGAGFRNYFLSHDVVFGYERLKKIIEKNGDGSKSYNPIVFDYGENNGSGLTAIEKTPFLSSNSGCYIGDDLEYYPGDFDGDGDPDLIYRNKLFTKLYDTTAAPVVNCLVDSSNPHRLVGAIGSDPVKCLGINPNGYYLMSRDAFCKVQVAYTGDPANTLNINVYAKDLNSSAMIEEYSKKILMPESIAKAKCGDFNGDALSDYIFINSNTAQTLHFYYFNLDRRVADNNSLIDLGTLDMGNPSYRISTGDFNGDGKTDIICLSANNTIKIYTLEGTSLVLLWQTPYTFIHPGTKDLFREVISHGTHDINHKVWTCCDYDGPCNPPPGYPVTIGCLDDGWGHLISGFITYTEHIPITEEHSYPFIIGDYNSDGKSDILLPGLERSVLMSTGVSFESEALSSVYPSAHNLGGQTIQTDYNNDGKSDLLTVKKTGANKFTINDYQRIGKSQWVNNCSQTYTRNLGEAHQMGSEPIMVLPSKGNFGKPQLITYESYWTRNEETETTYVYPSKMYWYTNETSFTTTKLMNNVTLGNGVKQSILYRNLTNASGIYSSAGQITTYPNYDIGNTTGVKVVSQIDQQSATTYRRQLYKYYGYTSNVEGLGFLGFRGSTKTNWFDALGNAISTVTKSNMNYRGAPNESFSLLGVFDPAFPFPTGSSYIRRSNYSYAVTPTANGVYRLNKTFEQNFDGLYGTITEITPHYDSNHNDNLLDSTMLIHSNMGVTESKTVKEEYTYDDTPTGTPYFIGRVKTKTTTTTLNPIGDVSISEDAYTYEADLVKTITNKATNSLLVSDPVIETNTYNQWGNLTDRVVSSTGVGNRTSHFAYDPTHRFVVTETDGLGINTELTYDTNKGLLLTEKKMSGMGIALKTSYIYDTWGKNLQTTNYLGNSISYITTNIFSNNNGGVKKTTTGSDGSSSILILDDLGRKIHEELKDINDKWTCTSTSYDAFDRPVKVSKPYYIVGNNLGTYPVWDEFHYNNLGRLTQSNIMKSNSSSGKQTTYSYVNLQITENEPQHAKQITKNIFGEVISLTETGGPVITNTYFANGNLKTSSVGSVATTYEQDAWGRKKTMNDPSAGIYRYTYNNLGEITKEESDGRGATTYLLLPDGRIDKKNIIGAGGDPTNTTINYFYNPISKLLNKIIFNDTANNNNISYLYVYDGVDRIWKTTEIRNSFFEFKKEYRYDNFSRLEKEFFSSKELSTNKKSEKWIKHTYKNGSDWQIYDMTNDSSVGTKLWQTNTVNQNGDLVNANLGNGMTISKTYDLYGFQNQSKHDKGSSNILSLNTTFESIHSNLLTKKYSLFGWNETVGHDNLDRVTSYNITPNPSPQAQQTYNDNGTIASNPIGDHTYDASSPYRIDKIVPFNQDAGVLGYYTPRTQTASYNLFNSPIWIKEASKENIDFEYNASNNRSVMYYGDEQGAKQNRGYRKFYNDDGDMEIKRKMSGNVLDFVTYIGGDPYTAPVILKSDGITQNYYYLHRDYQGSIVAITDKNGAVVEKRMFDVWGALVKYEKLSVPSSPTSSNTVPVNSTSLFLDRGYTGHEHLLGVGLVNMNGRVYDPKLHKFLQPDSYLQDPFNTQNYNRYGYCLNNPTKYIDPSGEWGDEPGGGSFGGGWEWGSTWTNIGNILGSFILQNAYYNNNFYNGGYYGNPPVNQGPLPTTYTYTNFEGSYHDTFNFNNGFPGAIPGGFALFMPQTPSFPRGMIGKPVREETITNELIMKTIMSEPALKAQYERLRAISKEISGGKHKYSITYNPVPWKDEEGGYADGNTFNGWTDTSAPRGREYTHIYKPQMKYVQWGKSYPVNDLRYVLMHEMGHAYSSMIKELYNSWDKYPPDLSPYSPYAYWIEEMYADQFAKYWGGFDVSEHYDRFKRKMDNSKYRSTYRVHNRY